ncbi:rhamnulokinase [Pullulanibacillus pueri]|uniref:Rhamnulokinase n=1 Tax=Pullulanibacillus pueri TaxID=1437324 RepID=A0A8J2ZTW2_9BACL|nr:rhamnulokinase [Pullulanibacillus pueri]MBM7681164.1 rhamnulokinase [Pullulanibacillus pueri]GGH77297.1 rhamnulokinase [Pullulanibacillus pueri]
MTVYSLAVDIGASSGRLILSAIQNGKLNLEEIHRFDNTLIRKNDHICWDVDRLFSEIKKGIHKCADQGIHPSSIGIDTWAVDFVLLDEYDQRITDAVSYRDSRTDGIMDEVFQTIMKEHLYLETGIQFQKFNTLYQLYAIKKSAPEILERAKTFLMIPDYFHFLLTGIKANEYTNATSTQLVNAFTKHWDRELLETLGINPAMFQEIKAPKTVLGSLKEELKSEFGFDMKVILPATHDTASAVIALPVQKESIYISSGTWSLLGVENNFPICVTKALKYNFTNEGGIDYRFRFLKNIMGLWMIQEVKRQYEDTYTFEELVALAQEAKDFYALVDVNDDRFLNPSDMIAEIQGYCSERGQPVPNTPGEIAKCIYDSLAISYRDAIDQIEDIFEKPFKSISVIGGGSQNKLLNQLIADVANKPVFAGPIEATAIGNSVAQLLALGELCDINEARDKIKQSFEIQTFYPKAIQAK